MMTSYVFGRYAPDSSANAGLIALGEINARPVETLANTDPLVRYLMNTSNSDSDSGPEQLQVAPETLSEECSAMCSNMTGNTLLDQDSQMIHVAGAAATQAPPVD